ncbi:MAG: DUF1932 domain-containing protein [Deltaproteobacteria bacterium]|nr:DUF1932 domain-containing protein [Deltaproteobacteria bacterium]
MEFRRIGILNIGEMGYHWARLLAARGAEPLTCVAGRSEATRQRCDEAPVRQVDNMERLVEEADLVVSIVVPSAALEVARSVAHAAAAVKRRGLPFLEANAISPMTAEAARAALEGAGGVYVDGCIIGSARRLEKAAVYVSGPQAERLAPLRELGLPIRVLGDGATQASAFKVVYAGFTKGLAGLFTELLTGAHKMGLLEQILERYEESFPGLPGKASGSITSLRLHAARRSEEMAELADTFRHAGLEPVVTPAIERLLKAVAAAESGHGPKHRDELGSLPETVEGFVEHGLLAAHGQDGGEGKDR